MTPDGLVTVARIVSPFGRVGELKAMLETDFPEQFADRKILWVVCPKQPPFEKAVMQVRFHKGAALVKLEGVDSIDDAERLRGCTLAISSDERAELEDDEFWLDDIVGMDVFLEDGSPAGKVTEVLQGTANDVWYTRTLMIPAIRDVVLSVDTEARKIVIRPMEGMEISSGGRSED